MYWNRTKKEEAATIRRLELAANDGPESGRLKKLFETEKEEHRKLNKVWTVETRRESDCILQQVFYRAASGAAAGTPRKGDIPEVIMKHEGRITNKGVDRFQKEELTSVRCTSGIRKECPPGMKNLL